MRAAEIARRGALEKADEDRLIDVSAKRAERAVAASTGLEAKGFWVLPIRPPTVPAEEARLRFSLTYDHSQRELSELLECVDQVLHARVC